MKKIISSKIFITVLVTVLIIIVIIFSSIPGNPIHSLTRPLSVVLNPIQNAVSFVGDRIGSFFSAVTEGMDIREENQELKEEIAKLEYELSQSEEATRRWEELKDAFQIKDTFEQYEIIGSSILTREADEWFSVIRIDSGSKDGLNFELYDAFAAVDARMNLVGRVISSDNDTAKVLPLLHEGFSVSAKVDTVNGIVVRVTGENQLKQSGLCKVSMIPEGMSLNVGDVLVTSGKGGVFPAGIPIGVIDSVHNDSELNRYATLRPYTNLYEIKDVFVMIPEPSDDDSSESIQIASDTAT
ncbi:MAG: rod shape-determining protein MreC [Clostridiaceae bacterium]|nr:rod shape-determining protein MreC [Clostridiaceae bacterium]